MNNRPPFYTSQANLANIYFLFKDFQAHGKPWELKEETEINKSDKLRII